MAMNRETRRHLRRQGEVGADGTPTRQRRQPGSSKPLSKERATPRQFLSEIRTELHHVRWPSRAELANYSVVVVVTVVLVTAMIAGLDFGFGKAVINLFRV